MHRYCLLAPTVVVGVALLLLPSMNSLAENGPSTAQQDIFSSHAARKLAEEAIQAMGGNDRWLEINSAEVKGRAVRAGDTEPQPIRLVDNWQNGLKLSRFRTKAGKEQLAIRGGEDSTDTKPAVSEVPPASGPPRLNMARPHFGVLSGLAVHLPAISLSAALGDSHAVFSLITPPRFAPNRQSCIRVAVRQQHIADNELVIFCFNPATKLPAAAYIALPNLLGNNMNSSMEHVEYKGYRQVQEVMVPSEVLITRSTGRSKTVYFDSLDTNISYAARAAVGESR